MKTSVSRTEWTYRPRGQRLTTAAACTLLLLAVTLASSWPLIGSASPRRKTPIGRDAVEQRQSDETTPPQWQPNLSLGFITSTDLEHHTAVLYLDSQQLPADTHLIARDFELNPTAILQVTPIRRGRAVGLAIIQGTPLAGHEVIVPGSAYQTILGELLHPD